MGSTNTTWPPGGWHSTFFRGEIGIPKEADPAAGKGGGGQVVDRRRGLQGKFCISELNLRDLVHTFCQDYWKSPSSSPSYSPFRSTYYFLQVHFREQIIHRSSLRFNCEDQSKTGVQGAELFLGGLKFSHSSIVGFWITLYRFKKKKKKKKTQISHFWAILGHPKWSRIYQYWDVPGSKTLSMLFQLQMFKSLIFWIINQDFPLLLTFFFFPSICFF